LNNAATVGDTITTVSFYVSSVLNAIPATAGSVSTSYLVDGSVTQAKLSTNVAGNGPAFSAYKSSGAGTQSITGGVATKLTFDTEEFDTNNNFSSSRFTPTVAGYYQVNAVGTGSNAAYNYMYVSIFKNGITFKGGSNYSQNVNYPVAIVSALVYLNGSTDYIEIYVVQNITAVVLTGADTTYFQAAMIRSA
jgi:hypothetical protein